jgi:hypothetical protein
VQQRVSVFGGSPLASRPWVDLPGAGETAASGVAPATFAVTIDGADRPAQYSAIIPREENSARNSRRDRLEPILVMEAGDSPGYRYHDRLP